MPNARYFLWGKGRARWARWGVLKILPGYPAPSSQSGRQSGSSDCVLRVRAGPGVA
jgi:hypothetical protein